MIRGNRDPLEDERAAARLRTEPVRPPSDDGRLSTALGIMLVVILIAIVKPWGAGSPEPTRPLAVAPAASVAITPIPTQDRTAAGLAVGVCLGSGGWQVASLETWRTQDVRVWRAIDPIPAASGPLDPAIPSVPIVAIRLAAVGWCAPAFGPEVPIGPATVVAWTIDGRHATPLQLQQSYPTDGSTPLAALYVPLTLCPAPTICASLLPQPEPRAWATERVVFWYRDSASGRQEWFGADIEILEPTPGPVSAGEAREASRTSPGP